MLLPASSSIWTRVIPMRFRRAVHLDIDIAELGERLIVLRDLIALRQVRIEIVLAREHRSRIDGAVQRQRSRDRQFHRLTAEHGRAPGIPKHTGQTLVLGGAPKLVAHPQKILV